MFDGLNIGNPGSLSRRPVCLSPTPFRSLCHAHILMLFRKHSLTLCLQKKALEETKAMIPTLRERITSAREKLESYLVRYITFRACNYVVLRHALALASAPFVLSNPASPFNRKEPRAVANANHFPVLCFFRSVKIIF